MSDTTAAKSDIATKSIYFDFAQAIKITLRVNCHKSIAHAEHIFKCFILFFYII